MGIKFKTEDGQVHQVNNQTGEMETINGSSGYSGGVKHEEKPTKDWHTDDDYYKQIVWNMGTEISQLKEENKTLKAQIQAIQKLMM